MTNPLPKLQQEAREELREKWAGLDVDINEWFRDKCNGEKMSRLGVAHEFGIPPLENFLDRLTARVYAAALDAVESGMPEQELLPLHCSDTTFAFGRGRNDMRTQLLSHLRTLREGITGNEHAK